MWGDYSTQHMRPFPTCVVALLVLFSIVHVSDILTALTDSVSNTVSDIWAALFHGKAPGGAPAGTPAHHTHDPRGPAAAVARTASPAEA